MNGRKNNLIIDVAIIALSAAAAVILAKTGIFRDVLTSTREIEFLGSFIAGMFFASIFTVAPATVVLGEIARSNSVFLTALVGGTGALFGDFLIYRFVKDRLSEDFMHLINKSESERLISVFRLRLFKRFVPFVGALIVASPLPDELGLIMMGFSKMKTGLFVPISFLLNSAGILVIGLIARTI